MEDKREDKEDKGDKEDKEDKKEIGQKIVKELIEPTYYQDAKTSLEWRSRWKKIGDVSEAMAKILASIATIVAFAAGFFDLSILSFISGCLGTVSLVFLQFSSYAMNESRERTQRTNRILEDLGTMKIIDITIPSNKSMLSHHVTRI